MMGTHPSHWLTLGMDETLSGESDNEEGAVLSDTEEEEVEDISVLFIWISGGITESKYEAWKRWSKSWLATGKSFFYISSVCFMILIWITDWNDCWAHSLLHMQPAKQYISELDGLNSLQHICWQSHLQCFGMPWDLHIVQHHHLTIMLYGWCVKGVLEESWGLHFPEWYISHSCYAWECTWQGIWSRSACSKPYQERTVKADYKNATWQCELLKAHSG